MEAVLLHSSLDQSNSFCKNARNPRRNSSRSLVSRPSENIHSGLLISASVPWASFRNPQQQPPLLPLPIAKLDNHSERGGLSCSPVNRKINARNRRQSRLPSKSKSPISAKMHDRASTVVAKTDRVGPEPHDLPKDVSRVFLSSSSSCNVNNVDNNFSGLVFSLSPPPSSLPLPTFFLRPKMSCKAESAGIDAGATDDLRRLLRLR